MEGIQATSLESREKQWETIEKLIKEWKELTEGEEAFIVSKEWYEKWNSYVNPSAEVQSNDPPPKIDNSNILKPIDRSNEYSKFANVLKPKLEENVDFIVLPKKAWSLLLKW